MAKKALFLAACLLRHRAWSMVWHSEARSLHIHLCLPFSTHSQACPAQGVPGLFAGLNGTGSKEAILKKLRRLETSFKAGKDQVFPAVQSFLRSTSMSRPQQPHVVRS